MSLAGHIANITKTPFYELRKISLIRKCLTDDAAEILVHAFITSRLDYCNSLFKGLPKTLFKQLQSVQSAAARLLKRELKLKHITPILRSLHWLPVYKRVEYKVLLIMYKVHHKKVP